MQIVINIPDNMKVMCEWHTEGICDLAIPEINILAKAIANGTVLPKGHKRLIDTSDLCLAIAARMFNIEAVNSIPIKDLQDVIDNETKTIIEADKEV